MSVLSGLALLVAFATALNSDSLSFEERRKRVHEEKKRHYEALGRLETILSQDLREDLGDVFALIDIDGDGLLSNKERQFLYKSIVDNAVEMIFDDSQTLTKEEWCAVEFDVLPQKLAPSGADEQQMICQWEDDIVAEDCELDFKVLTRGGEILSRGQMTDYYYASLNPPMDWTPAQFEKFLFNSKRAPLEKMITSQAFQFANVKDVTSTVNDCLRVPTTRRSLLVGWFLGPSQGLIETGAFLVGLNPTFLFTMGLLGRRSLESTTSSLLTSIVSDLASSDDCDFTTCQPLHGMLGMLQHNTFCEEGGVEEDCVWTQNLFMPSIDIAN